MRLATSYESCSPSKTSPRLLTPRSPPPAFTWQSMHFLASPPRRGGILSLQELCWRTLKDHITTSNILDLCKFAEQYHLPVDIHGHCMRYVTQAYRILRERLGKAELSKVLDSVLMQRLEAAVLETERLESARKDMLGRVLEAAPPPTDTVIHEQSVGGHPVSYQYEALVSGVVWPAPVNPTAREQFLCASAFMKLFSMNYEAYLALPAWKRISLKQQLRLF